VKIPQDRTHSADMIFVGVSHDYDVQMFDRPGPEIRRYHVLADIDGGFLHPAERWNATRVNQHEAAFRKAGEQTVTLAHVDHA